MALTGAVRESFAVAVASGQSVTRAAKRLNIGRRTASRWLADPAFAQRVLELRERATDRALGMLARGAAAAADKLRRLLAASDGIALRAAVEILNLGSKRLADSAELDRRLTELEARLPAMPARNGVYPYGTQ